MTGRQAMGNMTLHLDINNAAVGYKLRTMQRQIHQVSRAWKAQSHTLWIAGQHEEALRVKMDGVREQFHLEHEYIDRATKSIEASNRAKEQGNKKYQRLVNNRDAAIQQLQEYSNQVKHAEDLMTLHNDELLRSSRLAQSNNEIGRARVNELKAEGRESEANAQHMRNYRIHLEGLRNEYQAVQHTIQKARDKGLTDPIKFPEFNQERARLHQLQAEIAETIHKQTDFDDKLVTSKRYNNLYNQTTSKVVASLKRMKQSAQANRVEYNRLISNQDREAQALEKERDKTARIAQESGRNSVAYQREYGRLISLNSAYTEHISRINALKDTYGHMSHRVATNIDNQRLKIRRLNFDSHREVTTAHSLTNASFALGAGFIYGAHQAIGLENEFNKVRNLLNTSGESYRQSTKDIHKMGKATEQYSLQYGVSQNKISKGFGSLVRRGYTGNQALAAQKSYLQGAIASGDKYSDVMDTAASTLESFGLRSNNTKKMVNNTKVAVNQLAYAADATSSDFRGIGYGMKFVGATAHSANQSVSETSSALGVLSNNGQDATNAGFGLRKVLNSFIAANHTKVWKKILPKLGLSPSDFQDAEGHFKKLSMMMSILQSHLGGKTDAEKTDVFHQLFGATGQESALILARSTHQLSSLNGQVAKSQDQAKGRGYAARIAHKNMNSTQMQMKRLQMAGEDLAKTYAQGLNPAFKRIAGASLKVAEGMSMLPKPMKNAVAIGTTLIPVVAGVNYGLAALNKVHALSIKTSLRMMGIGRNEQEQLKTKINTSNAATEANDHKNQSLTDTVKLYQQEQEAEAGASQTERNNTATVEDNNAAKKSDNMSMMDHVRMMSREGTAKLRNSSILARWNNATGGSIGTGMVGKAGLRYGGAGLGMGTLIGGTEALNGDVKNGAEDFIGTTGGTALGGIIGGPMGAMIGGVAGPIAGHAIGRFISNSTKQQEKTTLNHGLSKVPEDTIGTSQTRQFNDNLNGISTSSQNFVRREVKLQSQATSQTAMAGGKISKSAVSTYNNMLVLAKRYGDEELQVKKNNLKNAEKRGLLNNSEYKQALSKAQYHENSTLQNIEAIQRRLITSDRKTDEKDITQREKDIKDLNAYMLKLTNSGYSRMKKLRKNILDQDTHLSEKQYGRDLKLRKRDYNSAIRIANRKYRNNKKSLKTDLLTSKHELGTHSTIYKDEVKNYHHMLGVYRKEHTHAINSADKEKNKVGKAIDQRVSHSIKQEYQHKIHVEQINAKKKRSNQRFERDDKKSQSWLDHHRKENEWYQKEYQKRSLARTKEFWGKVGNFTSTAASKVGSILNDTIIHPGKGAHNIAKWSGEGYRKVKNLFANGTPDTQAIHLAVGNLPGINRNENAIINDGGGRELVKLPNGQFVLPSGRNVHTMLPKGTSVFNATQTRRILGMVNQSSSLAGYFKRQNGALFNDSSWYLDLTPTSGWIPRSHAKYSTVPGYAHGGLTKTDKLAHISEGNKPEMVLPLTNRSRAVQLMLKSLQYMFGGNQTNSQQNRNSQASTSEREFEKELIRSNRQKDYQINKLTQTTNNILAKMTILIKTVQNKPVISDVDIYNANQKQSLKNLRLRNLNRGSF